MQNDINGHYCYHLISQSHSAHTSGKNLKSIFHFLFLSYFFLFVQNLAGKTRGLRILLKVAVTGFLQESHSILLVFYEILSRFFAKFYLGDFLNTSKILSDISQAAGCLLNLYIFML